MKSLRWVPIVKVRFLGHLRTRLNIDELNIPVEGEISLTDLLTKISNLKPELQQIIKSIVEYTSEYLLLINDVDINVYGDLNKVKIRDGDTVVFVPVVHGGKE